MNVFRAAADAMDSGVSCALVTLLQVQGSTPRHDNARMLVYQTGEIVGTVGGGNLEYELIKKSLEAIQSGNTIRFAAHLSRDLGMCWNAVEAMIEPLHLVEDLAIYGAGHVGRATARMATALTSRPGH